MSLTIQYQIFEAQCSHCGRAYDAVRGPVYDGEEGVGLYLAGLHRCNEHGSVVMTIAFLNGAMAEAFTVQAWSTATQNRMAFADGAASPWAGEAYLGRMLAASECRESVRKQDVFEVADLICGTIPEVVRFLDEPD